MSCELTKLSMYVEPLGDAHINVYPTYPTGPVSLESLNQYTHFQCITRKMWTISCNSSHNYLVFMQTLDKLSFLVWYF